MESPRHGFEAAGAQLARVKPFYDAVFGWEVIQLDEDNPTRGYIRYSEDSEAQILKEVNKPGLDHGVFVVNDIEGVCRRVKEYAGEVHAIENWEDSSWCYCSDPENNYFSVIQHHSE